MLLGSALPASLTWALLIQLPGDEGWSPGLLPKLLDCFLQECWCLREGELNFLQWEWKRSTQWGGLVGFIAC